MARGRGRGGGQGAPSSGFGSHLPALAGPRAPRAESAPQLRAQWPAPSWPPAGGPLYGPCHTSRVAQPSPSVGNWENPGPEWGGACQPLTAHRPRNQPKRGSGPGCSGEEKVLEGAGAVAFLPLEAAEDQVPQRAGGWPPSQAPEPAA